MNDRITSVVVVGGGDVGLLTSLAIREMVPEVNVTVVADDDVPRLTKSTYVDIQHLLHGALDIDEARFIAAVRPVWKGSLYFRDWCGDGPFQYSFDPASPFPHPEAANAAEHYYYHYEELYDSLDHLTKGEEIVDQRKSPWYYDEDGELDRYERVAYHLEADRFNEFLINCCRERDVTLVDDRITAVETTGDHVDRIRSDRRTYEADLFVDATGFTRALRGVQDVSFRDFDFPLDSAFYASFDRSLSDVVPATVVESGDNGWFWQIDTYQFRDVGYVFASEYVDDGAAREEFLSFVHRTVPDGRDADAVLDQLDVNRASFSSGYYDRAWVSNCLAVGNAEGFVEPLQSTALTANATLAVEFAKLLADGNRRVDQSMRDQYNDLVRRTWESIHDFIGIHYAYADGETEFWEEVVDRPLSPRTKTIAETFDEHGFDWNVDRDPSIRDLEIFELPDFYIIMRNLGATSEWYETGTFDVSVDTAREREQFHQQVRETVRERHLTTEQLYDDVLGR